MCGIHGFINTAKKENNADDFIRSSFVANSLRGMDSCGIASINVLKKVLDYHKLPVNGSTFIQDKYADALIREARQERIITIGHNRAATTGKVGYNSAHPFYVQEKERELVGVHNGTLTYWNGKKNASKFTVDSEWALNHIFDNGMEAFKDFTGAFCFVWWDSDNEDTLNIALNSERPMSVAFTEDGNMAYASEDGMLYWLMRRHNLKIKGPVLLLSADKWYKFPSANPANFSKEDLPKSTTPTYTTAPVNYTRYNQGPTIIEKVDKLLTKIAGQAAAQPTTALVPVGTTVTVSNKPNVTVTELQNARELGVMSKEGIFEPYWYDEATDCIIGTVYLSDNSEFSGTIRNSGDIDYDNNGNIEWSVRVIGIEDDGKELTAICGKPTARLKAPQTNVATA